MDYLVSHKKNISIIKIKSERGTVKDATAVKDAIDKEIDAGFPNVIIDMHDLTFVDSNFLGSLVTGLKHAIKAGGDLRLVGFQQPVKTMFELTRLYNIFRIYDDQDEAVSSFSKPEED
jgi:anti-sigma B factor antagonist